MKFDILRTMFICGSFAAMFYGMISADVALAAFMGTSFGFQFALWLVDRDGQKTLERKRRESKARL